MNATSTDCQRGTDRAAPMHVLHICGSWPPQKGGVSDYVYYLHRTLADQGDYSGHVITSEDQTRHGEHLDCVAEAVSGWGWTGVVKVVRAAMRQDADLIHLQMPAGPYGRLFAPGFIPLLVRVAGWRKPIIVTVHEFKRRSRLGRMRTLLSCLPADRVVTVDQCNVELFPQRVQRKSQVILVGPNLPGVAANNGFNQGAVTTFGYFGAVRPTKGVEDLILAYHAYRRRGGSGRLRVIGRIEPGFFQTVLKPLLSETDLTEAVDFSGGVEPSALPTVISEIDVGVLPFPDGLSGGRTSFTALATMGIPVITTPPCCQTMQAVGPPGVVFAKAGDAVAISDAMWELSESPDRLRAATDAARSVAEQYSWDDVARQYRQVYTSALRARRQNLARSTYGGVN